ncbi:MAG: regulatory protein RecX [Candidatus Sacchiramonaceae bacterium]|nr:regulatory protein RecX [Candidatus Saccharimonadaceae bacterium]
MSLEIFSADELKERSEKSTPDIRIPKNSRPTPKYASDEFIITDIKQAVRNPNRVNISVNGKYRFSLDIFQLTFLGIKIGAKFTLDQITELEQQSEFGKLYARALEYCLMRPHSEKEVKDYLWKKTLNKKLRNKKTGEFYEKQGVSQTSADQVLARLKEKGYIDDERFAQWWVENRNQRKGSSIKKLKLELQQKGVNRSIIDQVVEDSNRDDKQELKKIIAKKAKRYSDRQKLISYLLRQGFLYDDILRELDGQ